MDVAAENTKWPRIERIMAFTMMDFPRFTSRASGPDFLTITLLMDQFSFSPVKIILAPASLIASITGMYSLRVSVLWMDT